MRICRYELEGKAQAGFYFDDRIVPLAKAVEACAKGGGKTAGLSVSDDLLRYLPGGAEHVAARSVAAWLSTHAESMPELSVAVGKVRLLTPIARPNKILLLAGNYAKHIEEGGGTAVERRKTFPYVFMKPGSTTINHPDAPIAIPKVSPNHVDWECELAVVMGKRAKSVKEADALAHVAGYMVINDVSDREYRPNPQRQLRPKDTFFDWQHGKWHDGFCPAGPCIASADILTDPQTLRLTLKLNGATKQDSNTSLQIFPVAAVIEFLSSFVTLEPGDIISTGTPAGVGHATGTYLKPGDKMEAAIEGIGVLRNHMVAG
ncbi:MAG: FAA hydrolase family protein [Pedosphaera sp.]|nr:FAA hydrolase family protein [Pedosphaera sp.]MSU44142.1 FAA hydrolase family protein [Pedosphaera sp.]